MEKCLEEAAFDPGIGKLCIDFNTFINDTYSKLMSFQSISSKRACFRTVNTKIYEGMENNTAFFLGCMLWAHYLKSSIDAGAKLKGNPFLNLSGRDIEEYDYLMNINFLENYFDSFERDTLYYIGRKIQIPAQWKEIIELYKEFLELNKGFVNTKTVSDIILPKKIAKKSYNTDIKELIENAVKTASLKELLSVQL